MKTVAACVGVVLSVTALAQQEVRWINPAGGAFLDASNWEGGVVPGSVHAAVFDLAGTYTVTGPASGRVLVQHLRVREGHVTFDVPHGFQTRLAQIGTATGPRVTVHLNTSFVAPPDELFSTVGVNNAVVTGSNIAPPTGGLFLSNNAEVDGWGGPSHGHISVDATSTLRGGWYSANQLTNRGRVILNSGALSVNSLSGQGGDFVLTNSVVLSDGTGIDGGTHLFVNSTLEGSGLSDWQSGDFTFTGPEARWGGGLHLDSGRLVLRDGARAEVSVQVRTGALVEVGPGSLIPSIGLVPGAALRVTADRDSPAPQVHGLGINGGRLEVVVDALRLPQSPPLGRPDSEQRLDGAIVLQVQSANALTVGQQIPIMVGQVIMGGFTSVELPALAGGRALQLVRTSTSVRIDVVAGGSACWSADFDGDGDFATDADIEAFFACLAGNCCATCGRADFNGDGDSGTDADIESFFRVLAGNPC